MPDPLPRPIDPPFSFATALVTWQRAHGRHDLPWQAKPHQPANPYHVWLSEVMLQQTQVTTVVAYFERFIARLPTIKSLAAAPQDEVLALWSGLGYYARARNLHAAAQQIVRDFGGAFPQTAAALTALRGVGPSTAAAIAAFCFGERVSILDGNAKRVIARVLAFEGDLAQSQALQELWQRAAKLLPTEPSDMPRYTQALMDLGATLCHVRSPQCARCPVQTLCQAHASSTYGRYPVKTKKLKRTSESWWLLLQLSPSGDIRLIQRPRHSGIWAGLWTPPIQSHAPNQPSRYHLFTPFKHVLTHKDLWLHVCLEHIGHRGKSPSHPPSTDPNEGYFDLASALRLALPAPIRKILQALPNPKNPDLL